MIFVTGVIVVGRSLQRSAVRQPSTIPVPAGFPVPGSSDFAAVPGDIDVLIKQIAAAVRDRLGECLGHRLAPDVVEDIAYRASVRAAYVLHRSGPSRESVLQLDGASGEGGLAPNGAGHYSEWETYWSDALFAPQAIVCRYVPPYSSAESHSFTRGASASSPIRGDYPWIDENRPFIDICIPVRPKDVDGKPVDVAYLVFEYQYNSGNGKWRFVNCLVYYHEKPVIPPAQ